MSELLPLPPSVAADAVLACITADVPVLLWGDPGIGKSAVVRQVATGLGWDCVELIGSLRDETDFGGLPVRTDGGVEFVAPRWARTAGVERPAIVFLDELTSNSPAKQAAMLRIVLDREVGDHSLSPEVRVVAAANPAGIAANGFELAAPLANRFVHLDVGVHPGSWVDGFRNGWPAPTTGDLPAVPAGRAQRWRDLVASFIVFRPKLLHQLPSRLVEQGRAWPSPRSWELAARVGAAAETLDAPQPVLRSLLAGCVGDGAAVELLAWAAERDVPDPEALLADPESFELPTRLDRANAVLDAVVEAVRANPTKQRWQAAWKVLARAAVLGAPDLAVHIARSLTGLRQRTWDLPPEIEAFRGALASVGREVA